MKKNAFCLFETTLGQCGIAWREGTGAVTFFQFPEATVQKTRARIARCCEGEEAAPPPEIGEVIEKVRRHLAGEPHDFLEVTLDLETTGPFRQKVYELTRKILPGQTRTYGELARLCGSPGAARAVGHAMACNPIPLIVPCHRVLAAGSKSGGFSAPGGLSTKEKLLRLEGVVLGGTLRLDL